MSFENFFSEKKQQRKRKDKAVSKIAVETRFFKKKKKCDELLNPEIRIRINHV